MTRPPRTSLYLGLAAAALVGLVALSFVLGPSAEERFDDRPAPPCPEGFVDAIGEGARVREGLAALPEGAALLAALRVEVRWCFGVVDVPVVADGRVLVMDRRAPRAEQIARAGHLLLHVTEGLPLPETIGAGADCDALVARAIEREAEAHVLEARLRRALELPPDRYEFEPALWAAPEADRVALVARYLREHPDGAPNVDALASGYRQRCETERRAASR